ncbi:MAG: VWA domain-containing protein [Crocinitomicaceae bacterium]|nr:VWA domain-containing protein [Crocinitomicaceae bacterium]
MFRFAHEEYLWALAFIPVVWGIFLVMVLTKKRSWKKLGNTELLKQLSADTSASKPVLKLILFCLAFASLVIGLANPQIGTRLEEAKREGVDVIIALDVSNSMLAEDIRPNRLERSKMAISRFIDQLKDDRIGLIVFAGKAYVQLPVTTDFAAAKLFLSSVDNSLVPTQGTAIGAAIDLSMQSFVGDDNKHKALVIITDGENHEDDAAGEAKKAAEEGIVIHTIGMGSVEGSPIPVPGGTKSNFMKDENGNVVVTKLNQALLENIASEGNGIFVRGSNADDGLQTILKEIEKMDKKTFGAKQFTDYEDRFQYFIAAGWLFLLVEWIISNRVSKWMKKLNAIIVER